MNMIKRNLIECTSCTSFSTTDKSLDSTYILTVNITLFLLLEELLYLFIFRSDNLILLITEELIEAIDEVHETYNFLIANGNITRSFISYMHVMALLYKST